jgi:hypothetical protein
MILKCNIPQQSVEIPESGDEKTISLFGAI